MENQYNYYKPEENRENGESGPSYQGPQNTQKHGKNKTAKKAIAIAGFAVMFGVIGGISFQGTNYLVGRALGTGNVSSDTSKTSTVSTAQLSTTKSTVTSDVSEVAENAIPSIVSITNMSVQEVQSFFGGTQQQQLESVGSGIIIAENDTELLIVTNNHVVEGSETLTVSFSDETSVEAQIKGTDSARDLAVVAVPLENISKDTLDTIKIATLGDSSSLKVGEPAIAIGNALGYGQSVTTGIVSAAERTISGFDGEYIQTDAAINPGNSGGALLNAAGEVVGINSAKITDSSVEGMGYAIPISDVSDIITDLMNQETKTKVAESERGLIGIRGLDVTSESAQMYNMPSGVYVSEVIEGGGAEAAGIQKGYIITALEGTSIDSMETLQNNLAYYKAGEEVTVTVQVPNESSQYVEKEVKVTLGKNS